MCSILTFISLTLALIAIALACYGLFWNDT